MFSPFCLSVFILCASVCVFCFFIGVCIYRAADSNLKIRAGVRTQGYHQGTRFLLFSVVSYVYGFLIATWVTDLRSMLHKERVKDPASQICLFIRKGQSFLGSLTQENFEHGRHCFTHTGSSEVEEGTRAIQPQCVLQ